MSLCHVIYGMALKAVAAQLCLMQAQTRCSAVRPSEQQSWYMTPGCASPPAPAEPGKAICVQRSPR